MELFPLEALRCGYSETDMYAAVENAVERLVDEQRLKPEESFFVQSERLPEIAQKITAFFCGPLGRDMLAAVKSSASTKYSPRSRLPMCSPVLPEAP